MMMPPSPDVPVLGTVGSLETGRFRFASQVVLAPRVAGQGRVFQSLMRMTS
jgi:hypothetical protein